MTDLGETKFCLGIHITCDCNKHMIKIDQSKYINDIAKQFGMQDCKRITTPLDLSIKLTSNMSPVTEKEKEEMSKIPYQNVISSLMYAMVGT